MASPVSTIRVSAVTIVQKVVKNKALRLPRTCDELKIACDWGSLQLNVLK